MIRAKSLGVKRDLHQFGLPALRKLARGSAKGILKEQIWRLREGRHKACPYEGGSPALACDYMRPKPAHSTMTVPSNTLS